MGACRQMDVLSMFCMSNFSINNASARIIARMRHFVGVGACYLDTILCVPRYPSEDEKLRASSITTRRGGNCANTLEVLQDLFGHVNDPIALSLIAVLPDRQSSATTKIVDSLKPTVSVEACIFRENYQEPPSSYIIKNDATGSRTIVNHNDLPEMTCDEFSKAADVINTEGTWYHFEGRIPDVTLQCIQYLRKSYAGAHISVELEKPGRQGLQELVSEANVVFYSKSWAIGNGYHNAEDCLRAQAKLAPNALLLCCTWGEQGSYALEPRTDTYCSVAANMPKDSRVIDTIGAGDTFIAGILYTFFHEHKTQALSQKLAFANRLAGFKVAQEGFSGLSGRMQLQP
ncbi:putative PfkB family kinase [Xylaria bambusicola]|uniref:putative PfkB family kinase n=1 Tax=Xylaria bambusicola TaxID=326684 RepID=UPI0020084DAC|nr:putative PfkB family kinase [Xylaria bambusicola]KAI0525900.1 putative PfkB family kinase [Xylaria bambusicola]